jgi:hypothetical protein
MYEGSHTKGFRHTVFIRFLPDRMKTVPAMPKSLPDHQRLAGDPSRWPAKPRGTACKVYMGSHWASGTWEGLQGGRGAVWLAREQRMVFCGDSRNVCFGS